MPSLHFEDLPIEIIRRVLAVGDCSNALVVSLTSKLLRTVCTDPRLYTDIVKHLNHDGTVLEWWDEAGLALQNDWHICARWALAKSQAVTLLRHRENDFERDLTTTTLRWLPELIAQEDKSAILLLRAHGGFVVSEGDPRSWSAELISRAAFLDVCRSMLEDVWRSASSATFEDELVGIYSESFARAYAQILHGIDGDIWTSRSIWRQFQPSTSPDQSPHWIRYMVYGILVIGIMHRRLCRALNVRTVNVGPLDEVDFYPPNVLTIPFRNLYRDCLLPYTTPSKGLDAFDLSHAFLAAHVPYMTCKEFLMDGEWVGYYNYTHRPGRPTWDPMMRNIEFEVEVDDSDYIMLQSRGIDGCGSFRLFGKIHKSNGWTQMTKEYDHHGTTWQWSAFMTPFGLVGTWGASWGGWIWLWKKSWTPSWCLNTRYLNQ